MSQPPAFASLDYRHVPGRNARPVGGPVEAIHEAATEAEAFDSDAIRLAWRYGLFLISDHAFWEAHEVLEPVWMAARPNSRERVLVQAFIQLANACLKQVMERPSAARRLSAIALGHAREAACGAEEQRLMACDVAAALVLMQDMDDALRNERPAADVLTLHATFLDI